MKMNGMWWYVPPQLNGVHSESLIGRESDTRESIDHRRTLICQQFGQISDDSIEIRRVEAI